MTGQLRIIVLDTSPTSRKILEVILNEREGILVRLKARLAGAQHVVTKPLVRQRIVALVSEYACRRVSAQASNQLTGSTSLEDSEVDSCLERNEPGGTASSRTL